MDLKTIDKIRIFPIKDRRNELLSKRFRKMVTAKKFVVKKIFDGAIKEDDLVIVEEELPELEHGEYLAEALYLSIDPAMRAYAKYYELGQDMIGHQVAKVIESKNIDIAVGTKIVASFGWRTHTIVSPSSTYNISKLPEIGDLPISLGLGALGGTGISALYGFLDICRPAKGETVVVTAAAGAVGNHVGQIAKIKGCRVIGITGSKEKAQWLQFIGFDHVINYKTATNMDEELAAAAPNGIDCYFDNVGGELSNTIMRQMNPHGRVSVCGAISSYDSRTPASATIIQPLIIQKQLELKGFIATQFADRWTEGILQNLEWIKDGKLKYRESITDGFENAVKALMGVLKGENIGKALVRVKANHVESESVNFSYTLNKFKNFKA